MRIRTDQTHKAAIKKPFRILGAIVLLSPCAKADEPRSRIAECVLHAYSTAVSGNGPTPKYSAITRTHALRISHISPATPLRPGRRSWPMGMMPAASPYAENSITLPRLLIGPRLE